VGGGGLSNRGGGGGGDSQNGGRKKTRCVLPQNGTDTNCEEKPHLPGAD